MAEIARLQICLTLSTRFPKEPNKDGREGLGFGRKSMREIATTTKANWESNHAKTMMMMFLRGTVLLSRDLGLRTRTTRYLYLY